MKKLITLIMIFGAMLQLQAQDLSAFATGTIMGVQNPVDYPNVTISADPRPGSFPTGEGVTMGGLYEKESLMVYFKLTVAGVYETPNVGEPQTINYTQASIGIGAKPGQFGIGVGFNYIGVPENSSAHTGVNVTGIFEQPLHDDKRLNLILMADLAVNTNNRTTVTGSIGLSYKIKAR